MATSAQTRFDPSCSLVSSFSTTDDRVASITISPARGDASGLDLILNLCYRCFTSGLTLNRRRRLLLCTARVLLE